MAYGMGGLAIDLWNLRLIAYQAQKRLRSMAALQRERESALALALHCLCCALVAGVSQSAEYVCNAASGCTANNFAHSLISALTTSPEDIGAFKHTCACRRQSGALRTLRCEPARFGPESTSMARFLSNEQRGRPSTTAARRIKLLRSAAPIRLLSNASKPVLGEIAGVQQLAATGCSAAPLPSSPPGPWVALAIRGECAFTRKAIVAEMRGASALIVMDNVDSRGKGLMVMKDGSRLADSQPNHVEFEGRMIPLSIPIVAVSRKDGLLLARGEHACTIGYDGGWQAARTVNFILKRLQQFESGPRAQSSSPRNVTRCDVTSLALRLGMALAQLSQIAPVDGDHDAKSRQRRLMQDAIIVLRHAAPMAMRCNTSSSAALRMLESLMLQRARSSAAADAAHRPMTYERLQPNSSIATSFGAHVSYNDSLRLVVSEILPRDAAARIVKLAHTRAQDVTPDCDDAEGDMAAAWASWAGISDSEMDTNCRPVAKYSTQLLPRGCVLDEIGSATSASYGTGGGASLNIDDAWRWSWGWDKKTLKRKGAHARNATTARSMSAFMRHAMSVQSNVLPIVSASTKHLVTDAEAELRWLLGRVEQRIAQLLGVPRQHIEPPMLVQLRSGNRTCQLPNQSGVNWAMARSDAHSDEVSNMAYTRCRGDSRGSSAPPSFSETSFQATMGGPRTISVHVFLGDDSAGVCNDTSLSFLSMGAGDEAVETFVPAPHGSAVIWSNMERESEFDRSFPRNHNSDVVHDDKWRILRSSVYVDGQPKAGRCHVLRYRVRVRDTTRSSSAWVDKLRERKFLRSYDDMMKRVVTNRAVQERPALAEMHDTGTMAICVAMTSRRIAELAPTVQQLHRASEKNDFEAMQVAARRAIEQLPLMRILVPSLLYTAAAPQNAVKALHLYVAFDAGDPVFDFSIGNQTVADILRATLRNVYDRTPMRHSVILRFDGGVNAPQKPGPAFNFAAASAYADGASAIVRVNDDTAFQPLPQYAPGPNNDMSSRSLNVPAHYAWPDAVMRALQSFPQPEPHLGVIGPHCSTGAVDILTHDATHRTHLDIFRHYYPPQLADWWMDDWISSVYRDATNSRTIRAPEGWSVAHHTSNQGTRYDVDHANRVALQLELRRGVAQVQRWQRQQERQRAWQRRLRAAPPKTRHLITATKDNDDRIVAAATTASPACVDMHADLNSATSSANGPHTVYVLHHSSLVRRRVTMHQHLQDRCILPRGLGKWKGANFPNVRWITEHVALRELGTLAEGVDNGTAPTAALYDPLRFLRANETLFKTFRSTARADAADHVWQQAWKELRTFHPDQLTRGELSIALKHMAAWKQLANIQVNGSYQGVDEPFGLILEDDAVLCPLFRSKLVQYIKKLPPGWGLLSLGSTLGMHINETEQLNQHTSNLSANVFPREPVGLTMSAWKHHGTTAAPVVAVHEISEQNMFRSPDAYVLTRKAAKLLLAACTPLAFAIDAQLNVVLNALALRHKVDHLAEEVRVFWAEPTVAVQASGDGYDLGSGVDNGESVLQRQRRIRQEQNRQGAARARLLRAALALSTRDDSRRATTSNDYRLHAWLAETLTGKEEALSHYDAAIRAVQAWNASKIWRRRLATLHHNAGAELQRRSAHDGALWHFRAALSLAEPPSLETRVAIASTLRNMLPRLPPADMPSVRKQAIHQLRIVWRHLQQNRELGGDDLLVAADISTNVDAGDAAGMLGALLLDSGETTEAVDVFQGSTTLHPHRVVSWLNFGVALLARGDKGDAHVALMRAKLIDPRNEKVRRALEMLGAST